MKVKIRPRLDAKLVADARALGLDISRIVEEALIRETDAERIRLQTGQAQNRDGGDSPVQ